MPLRYTIAGMILCLTIATLFWKAVGVGYNLANREILTYAETPEGQSKLQEVMNLQTGDVVILEDEEGGLRPGIVDKVGCEKCVRIMHGSERIGGVYGSEVPLLDTWSVEASRLGQRIRRTIPRDDPEWGVATAWAQRKTSPSLQLLRPEKGGAQ